MISLAYFLTSWFCDRLSRQIWLVLFSALEKPCISWETNLGEAMYLTWMVQVLGDLALLWLLCKLSSSIIGICFFFLWVGTNPRSGCSIGFWWFILIFTFFTSQTCSYGSTKCGLRQLHASLLKECKGSKVGIHTASPGMVLTDLLLRYFDTLRFLWYSLCYLCWELKHSQQLMLVSLRGWNSLPGRFNAHAQ